MGAHGGLPSPSFTAGGSSAIQYCCELQAFTRPTARAPTRPARRLVQPYLQRQRKDPIGMRVFQLLAPVMLTGAMLPVKSHQHVATGMANAEHCGNTMMIGCPHQARNFHTGTSTHGREFRRAGTTAISRASGHLSLHSHFVNYNY
jgi:hypothetical protein